MPRTRHQVLSTAIEILDAEGPDALTYRRLAAELHTGVGTLYWHVENKDALLALAFDAIAGEVGDPFQDAADPDWQVPLRTGLLALWSVLRRHPWAAPLAITARGPNMLRFWDRAAALLLGTGFVPEDAAYAIATLRTFVIGNSMQNAAWHVYDGDGDTTDRPAPAVDDRAQTFHDDLAADTYPAFARLAPVFSAHDEHAQFTRGLEAILVGLGAPSPSRSVS